MNRVAILSGLLMGLSVAAPVGAQSAYCEKVRSRSNADAALLLAPTLMAQGLRYPTAINGPAAIGGNLQLRVGLAFSPLDFYRGLRLMDVSDADCDAHELTEDLERDLQHATYAPQVPALQAQTRFLESHLAELAQIHARGQARLASNLITMMEFQALRSAIDGIERKVEQLHGEAAQLKARGVAMPTSNLASGVERYQRARMKVEDKLSSLKSLDAWRLRLSGGYVPAADRSADYFVWVDFSYSLGGPWNVHYENNYLDARKTELHSARYEVSHRTDETRAQLRAAGEQAQRELGIIERQLHVLSQTLTALEQGDAPATAQVRDNLFIEQVNAASERIYLQTFLEQLARLTEGLHG